MRYLKIMELFVLGKSNFNFQDSDHSFLLLDVEETGMLAVEGTTDTVRSQPIQVRDLPQA